ncbi:MAG TPA: VWA domain-containing protein [Pyrinomonadaceae bacterium]
MANRRQTQREFPNRFLTAITLACVCGLLAASAQQQQQGAGGQQRPRRVAEPQASPTPKASTKPNDAKPSGNTGEEVDEGDVVRVDTQLVSVPAIVTNRAGRPVANLRADNFVVYENGNKQQIVNFGTTDAPFEIALLLDTSGSTRAEVALIRRAANAFIEALRPGDRVAVIAFNTAHAEGTSLATVDVTSGLTSDRAALRKAVENVGTSNGTPFYDALEQIADEVFHEPPTEETRGRRAVVALTDGVDSASFAEYEESRDKLMKAGLACYFIEVNTEDFVEDRLMSDCRDDNALRLSRTQLQRYRRIFNPTGDAADYASFCQLGPFERMQISRNLYNLARQEMNELAVVSGGKNFIALDLTDARRAFAQVAQEIGTQYSLGYYPTNKAHDGSFRQIRVEVRGVEAGTQVRAREGYTAPKG